jgi:hypothetical protein
MRAISVGTCNPSPLPMVNRDNKATLVDMEGVRPRVFIEGRVDLSSSPVNIYMFIHIYISKYISMYEIHKYEIRYLFFAMKVKVVIFLFIVDMHIFIIHVFTYICTCVYLLLWGRFCPYPSLYVWHLLYIYINTYIYIYIYIHIYMYIYNTKTL